MLSEDEDFELEDSEYLKWAVCQANATNWRGILYGLFYPWFQGGEVENSEFHYGEHVPDDVKRRLKAILASTPPERLTLHPPRENMEVWKVGNTYVAFTASQLSEGFASARIFQVEVVEPYTETVTLYRKAGTHV